VEGVAAVRDFRFEVSREGVLGLDAFVLRVVPEPSAPASLPQSLTARVKDAIGVTPTVVLADDIGGETWKAKRWSDQRGD
jgi:hypothetical protein